MDFFQFANYARMFVPLNMDPDGIVANRLWICLLVGGLCFLIVYVFQAVGLFTIARREGYAHKWMAFVPFFNLYYIGVCGQRNKVYAMGTRAFAGICVGIELLLVAGYILYYVSAFAVWPYIHWKHTTIDNMIFNTPDGFSGLPDSYAWMGWIFEHLIDYVLYWVELVFIILKLLLLMSFFKTYSANHFMLFSFVGALLPLTGILIYSVRNNTGMNYADYIRRLREREYRIYQQQYGHNNPYGGNTGRPPDPFGDYGGTSSGGNGSDPFGDYGSPAGTGSGGGSPYDGGSDGSSSGGGSSSGNDSPFDEFK